MAGIILTRSSREMPRNLGAVDNRIFLIGVASRLSFKDLSWDYSLEHERTFRTVLEDGHLVLSNNFQKELSNS